MKPIFTIFSLFLCVSFLSAQNTIKLHIFYTNDLRGGIGWQKATFMNPDFPPELGGGASTAAIINKIRRQARLNGEEVLLLDGGDFIFGPTPLGEDSKGRAIVEYMNHVGYDAAVPGINDFNLGREDLTALGRQAHFPLLAANVIDSASLKTAEPFTPYTIIEKNGLRIGLFGIVSKAAEQNEDPQRIRGLRFLSEVQAAQKIVERLREQNADIIITLAHLGLPYDSEEGYDVLREQEAQNIFKDSYVNTMELARSVAGIDLIVSGHIPRGYQEPWEDPVNHTICVQNYAGGGNLGLITLDIDKSTKTVTGYELPSVDGSLLLLSLDEFWPEKSTANLIRSLEEQYEPGFDEMIGVTVQSLNRNLQGESRLSNLMCDAMLESTGADFAFNNYVSMRADIPIGPITPRDLSSVFPFGNEIVVIKMEGKLLYDLMEGSIAGYNNGFAIGGGRIISNKGLPDGKRILSFKIGGKPLDPRQTYRVATSAYLAKGNYGLTKLAFLPDDVFEYTGIKVRKAVEEFVRKHSPLNIAVEGRWPK